MTKQNINAVLILDKPKGMSSNQALQKTKRLLNAKKAGHTGSLDPLATGLLPICLGEATKFSQCLLDANKTYLTTAYLGKKTTTGDMEGEILSEKPVPNLSINQVQAVLNQFIGPITQIPPMYAAIKHEGKPLYQYARQGIEVERKSREVVIHEIKLLDWQSPHLSLEVSCSKGTYIRTLVEDIGEVLGCDAHVAELRRTVAGHFTANHMINMKKLEVYYEGDLDIEPYYLPVDALLDGYPKLNLSEEQAQRLYYGQTVVGMGKPIELAALYAASSFIGTGSVDEQGVLSARRLMVRSPVG